MKLIKDFFIEAAIRKGAPANLAERVASASADKFSDFGKRSSGTNYKFQWLLDNDDASESFTIYGDGSFMYDSPALSVEGKLAPPHSATWIRRMVKSGVVVDYAKQDWAEFYCIRHGQ